MTNVTHRLEIQPRLDTRHPWQAQLTDLRTGQVTQHEVRSLSDVTALMDGKACQALITFVVMKQMRSSGAWDLTDDELRGNDVEVERLHD
jgi:hypothetical protein